MLIVLRQRTRSLRHQLSDYSYPQYNRNERTWVTGISLSSPYLAIAIRDCRDVTCSSRLPISAGREGERKIASFSAVFFHDFPERKFRKILTWYDSLASEIAFSMKSSVIFREGCSLNTEFMRAILAADLRASAFVGQFYEKKWVFVWNDGRARFHVLIAFIHGRLIY